MTLVPMAKTKRVNVRLEEETYNKLKKLADLERRELSDFVRLKLEDATTSAESVRIAELMVEESETNPISRDRPA